MEPAPSERHSLFIPGLRHKVMPRDGLAICRHFCRQVPALPERLMSSQPIERFLWLRTAQA